MTNNEAADWIEDFVLGADLPRPNVRKALHLAIAALREQSIQPNEPIRYAPGKAHFPVEQPYRDGSYEKDLFKVTPTIIEQEYFKQQSIWREKISASDFAFGWTCCENYYKEISREQPAPAQIGWIPGPPKEDGRYLIAYCDYYGQEQVYGNPTYYVNDPINASDNITHHAAWPQYPTEQPDPAQLFDDDDSIIEEWNQIVDKLPGVAAAQITLSSGKQAYRIYKPKPQK